MADEILWDSLTLKDLLPQFLGNSADSWRKMAQLKTTEWGASYRTGLTASLVQMQTFVNFVNGITADLESALIEITDGLAGTGVYVLPVPPSTTRVGTTEFLSRVQESLDNSADTKRPSEDLRNYGYIGGFVILATAMSITEAQGIYDKLCILLKAGE